MSRVAGWATAALAVVVGVAILSAGEEADTRTLDDGVPVIEEIRQVTELDAAKLPVAASLPMDGYDRALFGPAWSDTDGNGCDQRDDVLSRDASSAEFDLADTCEIVAISIIDPYSGETVQGARNIHIDHVVPLAAAWRAGAARWPAEIRLQFANDLNNLWAVDAGENMSKGDQTPDEWRPDNRIVWCSYAQTYTWVSRSYHLAVTAATRSALVDMIGTCR